MENLNRLAIHTMTTKPWDLETTCQKYAAAGVPGVGLWRQWLEGRTLNESRRILDDYGIQAVSLVRSGFYPHLNQAEKQNAFDDNIRALDEAAAMGAPQVVLVCGAKPELSLSENRRHITEGIASLTEYASKVGVKLAIEPLHPMYADCRSAVNTIGQCNDIIDQVGEAWVGIAADVYHIWWDPDLEKSVKRAGKRIIALHVCDWMTPTSDMLNDRGLMGEGCIDNRGIRELLESSAGYTDWIEVEVFSTRHWASDQDAYLQRIIESYKQHV